MREVAQLAGVAMSSVSRVLSGHPDVSVGMQSRVLAAVAELGYQPDLLAQSLRRQETMTIGFAVGDISNQLFAEIVASAETTLRTAGYSMLLTNSEASAELDAAHIRLLAQRRVDGIILSVGDEQNPDTLAALERLDVPVVILDRDVPMPGAVNVFSDHRRGMRQAVAHLLDLGHRDIAMINGQTLRPARERRAALEACYEERGLPPTYRFVDGTFSVEFGARAAGDLLSQEHPPTAIIAGGNQLMLGSLKVLRARGLRLGRDISFVGCDDIPVSELYDPPIAVVRRDTAAMGHSAAELMLALLAGEPVEDVTLPSEFVARASCGPVAKT
ncbi:MAG: LacI family DNA-binding transcriptional regulator [Actinobacteria bacterium]|nr:LacI family DNA-binding transcriptional regulator [Actinomycetota bacterium]MBV8395556.1 LacI family DNA-binding transcriptional regulator [Actinomycetota bacterium]